LTILCLAPRITTMRLFGTSGIRRLADATLLDISLKTGLALGQRYHRIIVGSDTRTSSPAIKHALFAGLTASGAKVSDAGILPTPTLAIAAKNFDCAAMITASHNPPEYNGIKLLNPDSSPFNSEQQQYIENCLYDSSLSTASWDIFQNVEHENNAVEQHIRHIRRHFPSNYNVRVVVDCGGGAATAITPELLKAMGCEVHLLNGIPTGFFPRPSEPTEDNLSDLIRTVKELNADLGLAHDGDADRVMAVDDFGRFISGDVLLSIFTNELGAQKIITNVDSSMSADDLGVSVLRSAVGDNNVSEMLRKGGDFGGEPSGAWIFPQSSLCPDGIYGAALLVKIAGSKKLSALADNIKKYPVRRGCIAGEIPFEQIEQDLVTMLNPLSVQKIDGLKFILHDGWMLVRQSGTEPKIRLTVEATTETRVQYIYKQVENFIMERIRK
jgi:phosphoglucosamine mutase